MIAGQVSVTCDGEFTAALTVVKAGIKRIMRDRIDGVTEVNNIPTDEL